MISGALHDLAATRVLDPDTVIADVVGRRGRELRRRRVAAGGALLLAAGGAFSLVAAGPGHHAAVTLQAAPTPATATTTTGTTVIRVAGVELTVPSAWPRKGGPCYTQPAGGGGEVSFTTDGAYSCPAAPYPEPTSALSDVHVTVISALGDVLPGDPDAADPAAADPDATSRPGTVDGVAVLRVHTSSEDAVQVASRGVTVAVRGADGSTRAALLDTLHVIGDDAFGCAPLGPGLTGVDSASGGTVVVPEAVRAAGCVYLGRQLVASGLLDAAGTVVALRAAPSVGVQINARLGGIRTSPGSAARIRLTGADGSVTELVADVTEGGVTDGTHTAVLPAPVEAALVGLQR